MSDNSSICLVAFAHWSRGCLVRLGITQRVPQKVAYVRWFHIRPLYYLRPCLDRVVFILSLDCLRNPCEFCVWAEYFQNPKKKKKKKNAGFIVKPQKKKHKRPRQGPECGSDDPKSQNNSGR
jgi:hypothetical protein